jgi:plastocyanin
MSTGPGTTNRSTRSRAVVLVAAVVAIGAAAAVITAVSTANGSAASQIGLDSQMAGTGGGSMMGWAPGRAQVAPAKHPGPGDAGFVAGTPTAPRIVRVSAGPGYAFSPSTVAVARGETVTFVVTTAGPTTHEFMVGPADAVAADRAGTPEAADIAMMQTKSVTYTFDGPGPFAFACHVDGHYEAGMQGTIVLVP